MTALYYEASSADAEPNPTGQIVGTDSARKLVAKEDLVAALLFLGAGKTRDPICATWYAEAMADARTRLSPDDEPEMRQPRRRRLPLGYGVIVPAEADPEAIAYARLVEVGHVPEMSRSNVDFGMHAVAAVLEGLPIDIARPEPGSGQ